MRHARYMILGDESTEDFLIIRDVGPWDKHSSVTNDAENVVKRLYDLGYLPEGRRLFCYDSEGKSGEILVRDNGQFGGFAPIEPKPIDQD